VTLKGTNLILLFGLAIFQKYQI